MVIININDVNSSKKTVLFLKSYFSHIFQIINKVYLKKELIFEQRRWKRGTAFFYSVEIETINRCNNDCPFCPVNKHNEKREYAKMSNELFYKIINELSDNNYSAGLNLFSNNEPLIDERIIEFAEYARNKLPDAKINLYTNGRLLTRDKFYELIKYIDYLQIDNYADDMNVEPNLQYIVDAMNKNDDINRMVNIVVMKKNIVRSTRGGESPNNAKKKKINVGCILPFHQIVIRPDGKVSLCCNDAYGQMTLGDTTKDSLYSIWQSEKYTEIRKKIRRKRDGISICQYCDSLDRGRR